ncbi:MAG TPA: hypothetical protein PKD96_02890, partial [Candidatus Absconditabacterales bacterium]|nr:hypothetical protein [Candidatus Absconditabacterales bacterium]
LTKEQAIEEIKKLGSLDELKNYTNKQRGKIKILGNALYAVANVLFGQSHGKRPENKQDHWFDLLEVVFDTNISR